MTFKTRLKIDQIIESLEDRCVPSTLNLYSPGDPYLTANQPISIQLRATETNLYNGVTVEPAPAVTFGLIRAPSWLTVNPDTGLITGTAPNQTSLINMGISASDTDGNHVEKEFYVHVYTVVPHPDSLIPPDDDTADTSFKSAGGTVYNDSYSALPVTTAQTGIPVRISIPISDPSGTLTSARIIWGDVTGNAYADADGEEVAITTDADGDKYLNASHTFLYPGVFTGRVDLFSNDNYSYRYVNGSSSETYLFFTVEGLPIKGNGAGIPLPTYTPILTDLSPHHHHHKKHPHLHHPAVHAHLLSELSA